MYGANSGVPNPQKAVNYYYKACVGGDAVACANLAMAYDNGQGVKEDKDKVHSFMKWRVRGEIHWVARISAGCMLMVLV